MQTATRTHRRLGPLSVAVAVLAGALVGPDARTVQAAEVFESIGSTGAGWVSDHRDHPSLGTVELPPDSVGRVRGGIAARVRRADDTPLPGDVFMLMGVEGSDATAVVYDGTPFRHDHGAADDSLESNVAAAALVGELTGGEIDLLGLTTAPGGGPSGGLAYVLAYLDLATDGGFTAGLRVAATGALESYGYVHPVLAVDEKVAAADLAGVDVVFVPSHPHTDGSVAPHRVVGETARARFTGVTLAEERLSDQYQAWGADRSTALDVVVVRHVVDVAAYLCGAGSALACVVEASLVDTVAGPSTSAAGAVTEPAQHTGPPVPSIR
jgi:hypothetical protein